MRILFFARLNNTITSHQCNLQSSTIVWNLFHISTLVNFGIRLIVAYILFFKLSQCPFLLRSPANRHHQGKKTFYNSKFSSWFPSHFLSVFTLVKVTGEVILVFVLFIPHFLKNKQLNLYTSAKQGKYTDRVHRCLIKPWSIMINYEEILSSSVKKS